MRMRTFRLMALIAGLPAIGLISVQKNSTAGTDSGQNSTEPSQQAGIVSPAEIAEEPPPPSNPPEPTPGVAGFANVTPELMTTNNALDGVVRQIRAGVEDDVLLAYIRNSAVLFNVGSEEIIYLTDVGASGQIINAMIERDHELQSNQSTASAHSQAGDPWPAAGTVETVPPAPEEGPVAVEESPTQVTVDYFYDYLTPYGSWVDIPEYGLCWQPSVVLTTRGWMPYSDRGRWVYTNYGWYWYSDYSWGWAAFHYGRWIHHSRWGWCWVPGTVWGPSWVTWRYTDSYCGWAPLPPYSRTGFYFSVGISWGIPSWCYTYIPSYRICTYYPRKCAVPYEEARRIHHTAKVCDNYAVGRDYRIHNRGISPDTFSRDSGAEIRRARVREHSETPGRSLRRERLEDDGKTLAVYQPRTAPRDRMNSNQSPIRNRGRSISSQSPDTGSKFADSNTKVRAHPTDGTQSFGSTTPRTRPDRSDINSSRSTPTRTITRSGPSSVDRTITRTVPTRKDQPSSISRVDRNSGSREATRHAPKSSLIIIGRGDSRSSSPATTPSRNLSGGRERSAQHTPSVSTRSPDNVMPRSEPSVPNSSTRSWSPAPTRVTPSRSVTQVPATTIRRPGVSQAAPTFPTRSTPPSVTRSSTPNRVTLPSSQRSIQPVQRPTYSQPAQRRVLPVSPARTISPSPQPSRPAPVVRTVQPPSRPQRSAPSYSPPPSRTTTPSAPRNVPSRGSSERSNGRGR